MSSLAAADDDSDESSVGTPEITLDALRPEALAALLAVRQERDDAAAAAAAPVDGVAPLPDDFGKSQFWYSDECADALAKPLLGGRVAVVSCPTARRPSGIALLRPSR